jgi:lipopolysaccharide transport system ATP-binding protein
LSHDLNRWWHLIRGNEDPYLKIGERNDRGKNANSDYVWALENVSFEVRRGDVLGIIGKNGAGKSTLLKVLSRITSPTAGCVRVKGRIASLLEVGTGFHPELTGRENIFLNGAILGMRKSEIQRKLGEIVEFSGCARYVDTPVKRYSSGMYVRLAFAVAAHLDPEILIVDEVLAVGDAEFQKKCLGKMKEVASHGRTVLFVSHNMAAVRSLCTRAILVETGKVQDSGSPSDVISRYYAKDRGSPSNADFSAANVGDSFVRLLSGAVRSAAGQVKSEFSLDEPVSIEMRFSILKESDASRLFPFPSFQFFSSGGECVLHSMPPNSLNQRLKPGSYVATCRVPGQLLNTGTYFVGFGFSHCETGVQHNFYQENAVSFQVTENMIETVALRNGFTGAIPGAVRPNLDWSLAPAEPPESTVKHDL